MSDVYYTVCKLLFILIQFNIHQELTIRGNYVLSALTCFVVSAYSYSQQLLGKVEGW